jgi:hypothetical protein
VSRKTQHNGRRPIRRGDHLLPELLAEPLMVREASATLPANTEQSDLTVRTFQLRADSVDEPTRSVGCVIATEQPVTVRDNNTYQIIDEVLRMDGVQFADKVPLLNNHFRWSLDDVLGSVRQMKVEAKQLIGRSFFASDDDIAERAWNKAKQGHITDVSVGYRSIEYTDIPPGQSREVKGQTYTAGQRTLRVTTRWEVREVSLVPVGADSQAKIREVPLLHPAAPPAISPATPAPPSSPVRTHAVNPLLRAYLESLGLRNDADEAAAWTFYRNLTGDNQTRANALLGNSQPPASSAPAGQAGNPSPVSTDGQRQVSPPSPAPLVPTGTPAPMADQIRAEAAINERRRIARINELGQGVSQEIITRAIEDGMDEARFAPLFLQSIRDQRSPAAGRGGSPAIHSRSHAGDCDLAAMQAALLVRTGCPLDRPGFSDIRVRAFGQLPDWMRQDINHADRQRAMEYGHRYASMSLIDVCREAVRIDGGRVTHDRDEMIRTAISGGSLTAIFSTNINAELLASYVETPDSTQGWVAETDVENFLSHERASMGKFGGLTKHKRGGEADHLDTSDSKEASKIARYSGQWVIDEMDIIDNRFGAIDQLAPADMGQLAAALRPDLIYAILLANAALDADGVALFHATHANTNTLTFGATQVETAVAAMAKQRIRKRAININPRYLITPQDLRFGSDIVMTSAQRFDGFSNTTAGGTENPLAKLGITRLSDDRLGVAGVVDPDTGTSYAGSATIWILAARPGENGAKTLVVKYRLGTGRMPQMRQFTLDRGQWGLGWDIAHDIGADADDYRGLYRGNV